MPVEMYLLSGGMGLVFGALVAWGNMRITRRSLRKNSTNAVMAASMLRMLMNIAALAGVYFTKKLLSLPFYGTNIGPALGPSAGGHFLNPGLCREEWPNPTHNSSAKTGIGAQRS